MFTGYFALLYCTTLLGISHYSIVWPVHCSGQSSLMNTVCSVKYALLISVCSVQIAVVCSVCSSVQCAHCSSVQCVQQCAVCRFQQCAVCAVVCIVQIAVVCSLCSSVQIAVVCSRLQQCVNVKCSHCTECPEIAVIRENIDPLNTPVIVRRELVEQEIPPSIFKY